MKRIIVHIALCLLSIVILCTMSSCNQKKTHQAEVMQTSAAGHRLQNVPVKKVHDASSVQSIILEPHVTHQEIIGFGGAFTEASAHLLQKLSDQNRQLILHAYFNEEGADYSLTRTHINSCDFSLSNYSYAPVENDAQLSSFTIEHDMDDLIPMIKGAMQVSKNGFNIIASPWTAPPWMKDNKDWKGGKLLPEYYPTWALFFEKYLQAYKAHGINIWGITVENEPLGNNNNWESMIFTPQEMNAFVKNNLGPSLRSSHPELKILGYDQNRDDELNHWADAMYDDQDAKKYYDGIAVHWYASTYDYFPQALQYAHRKAPEKLIIQTEACIDAEVPRWKEDEWYWSKKARDWGWTWAPEHKKHLHPEYVPAFRYAGDIIGCLNNEVNGWIDWNMVLDQNGGPNWAKNWCIAPIVVNAELDEVYITPLYYVMAHFSKYIRPGAVRIGVRNTMPNVPITAAKNPDGSIAVVLFNPSDSQENILLTLGTETWSFAIEPKAIQTVLLHHTNTNQKKH